MDLHIPIPTYEILGGIIAGLGLIRFLFNHKEARTVAGDVRLLVIAAGLLVAGLCR